MESYGRSGKITTFLERPLTRLGKMRNPRSWYTFVGSLAARYRILRASSSGECEKLVIGYKGLTLVYVLFDDVIIIVKIILPDDIKIMGHIKQQPSMVRGVMVI